MLPSIEWAAWGGRKYWMKGKYFFLFCGIAALIMFFVNVTLITRRGAADYLILNLISTALLAVSSFINFRG